MSVCTEFMQKDFGLNDGEILLNLSFGYVNCL